MAKSLDDISREIGGLREALARYDERQQQSGKDISEIKEAIVAFADIQVQHATCRVTQDQRWLAHDKTHEVIEGDVEIALKIARENQLNLVRIGAVGGVGGIVGATLAVGIPELAKLLFGGG